MAAQACTTPQAAALMTTTTTAQCSSASSQGVSNPSRYQYLLAETKGEAFSGLSAYGPPSADILHNPGVKLYGQAYAARVRRLNMANLAKAKNPAKAAVLQEDMNTSTSVKSSVAGSRLSVSTTPSTRSPVKVGRPPISATSTVLSSVQDDSVTKTETRTPLLSSAPSSFRKRKAPTAQDTSLVAAKKLKTTIEVETEAGRKFEKKDEARAELVQPASQGSLSAAGGRACGWPESGSPGDLGLVRNQFPQSLGELAGMRTPAGRNPAAGTDKLPTWPWVIFAILVRSPTPLTMKAVFKIACEWYPELRIFREESESARPSQTTSCACSRNVVHLENGAVKGFLVKVPRGNVTFYRIAKMEDKAVDKASRAPVRAPASVD